MIPPEDHLFGLLAVQVGLVDPIAFLDVCRSLSDDGPTLPDLLLQRGLILSEDRDYLTRLVRRKLPHEDPTPATAAGASTISPPILTDRYRYIERCGSGGSGDVWQARDTRLERDVAIKELQRRWVEDDVMRSRFLREVRVTCKLDHPGIVPVYDLLPEDAGRPRYAMRLLRGRTLSEAIRGMHQRRQAGEDVSLERAELLQAFVAICNTVGYAHSRGVIHRDLKPANVQLGDYGEVVVLDWGLAGMLPTEQSPDAIASERPTLPGHVFGTPEYMSPEQASGDIHRVGERSDIYGLGAILYQLLTDSPPFRGASLSETLALVLAHQLTPVRQRCPDAPAGLEAICHKALSKRPEDRYALATDLAYAVLQWQDSERKEAERALRESEERFRTLVKAVPQSLWISRPDGWLEYFNNRAAQPDWRRPDDEVNGLTWRSYVHPDDLPGDDLLWEQAQATGKTFESEYRVRLPDGSYRWYLNRAEPLRDSEGRISRWFGSTTDIHDLKEAVRQRDEALGRLRLQEAEYRAILDQIPHIVWASGPDGGNTFLNKRWYDYTGRSREESSGGTLWMQTLHPDDRVRTGPIWSACTASGEPFEIEYRLLGADGTYRWFLGRYVPLRDESGRIVRWFGTCTDIHEREEAIPRTP